MSSNAGGRTTGTAGAANNNGNSEVILSDFEQMEIVKFSLMFLGISAAIKAIFSALAVFYVIAFPLLYFYMLGNCPKEADFDAKKELKRVLRGKHLPESHPDKPKGFFERTAARIAASVATEISTLPGYEVEMLNLGGAAVVVTMRIPTSNLICYWIGALGKWNYVTSRQLDSNKND
jgi:hypothetical protein